MKIFTAIQTQWSEFYNAVTKYISSKMGNTGGYGPSNIFGQIFTVIDSAIQNMLLYIEDAFTEQNVYTAERKKSIYSLARLSGYEPHLGSASKCTVKLIYNSEKGSTSSIVNIPNRTKIISSQNGLIYNMILPQETYAYDITDNFSKYITAVEGRFETQEMTVPGGQLYTCNILFNNDIDLDYLTVWVNGIEWEKVASLYDMTSNGNEYTVRTGLDKGIDIIFGNGQFGKILEDGDSIKVEYLTHNGEMGNISPNEDITFIFSTSLINDNGEEIDGNSIFNIELENRIGISSGTYSESTDQVRKMIGYNSRALVLADAKNYKLFLNRFSFIGYNRCWSESGSLTVNALIIKNFKNICENGIDYFSLNEDDFVINDLQKESIREAIINSKQQIAGTVLNFIDPIIKKYIAFIYVRMKDNITYDKTIISNSIKNLIGGFFSDIKSDVFIPKSDIIQLIKNNISQIDGVDIYFVGEDNENAKINGYYTEQRFVYNPYTLSYSIEEYTRDVEKDENGNIIDPMIGFDDHGNILLENDMYFPVLMGDCQYGSDGVRVYADEAVNIIFQ